MWCASASSSTAAGRSSWNAAAWWRATTRATDAYTVYISSQGSHRIKRGLLDILELNDNQMHVITPDVGGGFGPKGAIYPEYPCVAACARLVGRPVKWIEDRRENFLCTHQERDQFWDLELAVDRDARILGLRGRLIHDTGAFVPWGLVLPWIAATTVPGPYVIPSYQLELNAVYTNMISTTPVRGAGRPQGVFVMERMMDRLAQSLGLDPAEVRRRNFITPEQMPYKVGIIFRDGRPVTYDSGDYPAAQAGALAAADYDGFPARQAAALMEGRYLGIGISNAVEGTGLGPYEGATVRIATTGKIVLYTGATPQGQSHKTTLAQIAADQLGVSYEDVTVATADTKEIAFGVGTFAARTAVNAGSSAHIAAFEVAKKIKLIAADMMEVSPDDLELRDGFAEVRGVPGMKKSFREISVKSIGMPGFSMAGGLSPGLENTAYFQPDQSTYSNGTHIAEVEVDIETGAVKILRFTVMHDCGTVINPMVVEGQVVGGVAHGIGNALFERLFHDAGGQPQTVNFADYLLPGSTDMPPIHILHSQTPSPLNPLGMKGAGEGGTIPGHRRHHRRGRERARAVRHQDQRGADQSGADRGVGEEGAVKGEAGEDPRRQAGGVGPSRRAPLNGKIAANRRRNAFPARPNQPSIVCSEGPMRQRSNSPCTVHITRPVKMAAKITSDRKCPPSRRRMKAMAHA